MAQNSLTHQYFWRDYSQSNYQSLVLTLNSYQALSLLAFVSTFIAYVQTRWWIMTRYLLIRIFWPNRLDDSDDPRSIHHLSQAKAITSLIFRRNHRDNHSNLSIPPWFGAVSLFNILLFIVLGTIIPYYLAGGTGSAKVLSALTEACDGFEAHSASSMQQAESFYKQCRLNASADSATCGYETRIVDSRPQLNFTLDGLCPFEEENCLFFLPYGGNRFKIYINKALKVAYLDMQPSDFGLNFDSRIRQSHSLTCVPLKIFWFRVPYSMPGNGDVTVFWVGYDRGNFNKSEKYASVGETVQDSYPEPLIRSRLKLKSGPLYELTIYRTVVDYPPGSVYENYHPGLKVNDGDMFIVRFKYGMGVSLGTPVYFPWKEGMRDPLDIKRGPQTYALGCFEQYQLCFDGICMGWSNATEATRSMFHFLQSNYDGDIASEVIKVHDLLIEATSLRNFVALRDRSPMMIRSILRESPGMEEIFKNSSKEQWHWEVQSWFEMSFLTAKFAFLASVQGTQNPSTPSSTKWICDKLLFLDNNPTNINFIGLMATLSGLLVLCLFSVIGEILTSVKGGLRWVGSALQRLWRDLLGLAYDWLQTMYEAVFQAMRGLVGLSTEFVSSIVRRSSERHSDYDDDEIWNSASINLDNLR
jgi:hypothetical protein